MLVSSKLIPYTQHPVYQNPNIVITACSFNQQYISVMFSVVNSPADKYLIYVDMNTMTQSLILTLDPVSTELIESFTPDGNGNYYYMTLGIEATDLKVIIYDRDRLNIVNDWYSPYVSGKYFTFGEEYNLVYVLTQYNAFY